MGKRLKMQQKELLLAGAPQKRSKGKYQYRDTELGGRMVKTNEAQEKFKGSRRDHVRNL